MMILEETHRDFNNAGSPTLISPFDINIWTRNQRTIENGCNNRTSVDNYSLSISNL